MTAAGSGLGFTKHGRHSLAARGDQGLRSRRSHGGRNMSTKLEQLFGATIASASAGSWHLDALQRRPGRLTLVVREGAGCFQIVAEPANPSKRAYKTIGDIAYRYEVAPGGAGPSIQGLDRVVPAVASLVTRLGPKLWQVTPATPQFPTPYYRAHLEEEVALPAEVIDAYRRDGHVQVRQAIDPQVIRSLRPLIVAAIGQHAAPEGSTDNAPQSAYSRAFKQVTNLGLGDPAIRTFTHSRRLGRMAADLMGVSGVRIFCEDWLTKPPGAGITPWHQDAAVFPFDAEATITLWIPFQVVGAGFGPLRYARGAHRIGLGPVENINDESEAVFEDIIREHRYEIDSLGTMRVGDISCHDGHSIHGAFANESSETRYVLALHCFADGARVKAPSTPTMTHVLGMFGPGLNAGDRAESAAWPAIYSSDDNAAGRVAITSPGPSYHLRGVVLPDGGEARDIWIHEGRIRFNPIDGAQRIDTPNAFILSGLVDAHSHISFPHAPDMPAHTPDFMNANRANYAATGVTLVRDMGSSRDDISNLGDVPGLPRVQPSGMMVLRHDAFPFTPTPPEKLVEVCLERLDHGSRWIKLFSDWSSDFGGKWNTGFTGEDRLTYPEELLREAFAAVHAAGGRVAVHCFTGPGTEAAVRSGCDTLEHGWGLTRALIDQMAATGMGWVPLLGITAEMWRGAHRDGQPERAVWMEEAMVRLAELLPYAKQRGVPILAGTDWFPQVTIPDEIGELIDLGLDAETAVAAGSWAARRFFGEQGIVEGAAADLVVYRRDPRLDPQVLSEPALILIGGRPVDPSLAQVRPHHRKWRDRARD